MVTTKIQDIARKCFGFRYFWGILTLFSACRIEKSLFRSYEGKHRLKYDHTPHSTSHDTNRVESA